ncbi:MAG: hypothetical protein QXP70_01205 [Methanomassiliicoccales archaeon]
MAGNGYRERGFRQVMIDGQLYERLRLLKNGYGDSFGDVIRRYLPDERMLLKSQGLRFR